MKDTLVLQNEFDAYKKATEARIMRLTAEVADLRHRHEGGVPMSRDERIAMELPPDPPEAEAPTALEAAKAALLLFEDDPQPEPEPKPEPGPSPAPEA